MYKWLQVEATTKCNAWCPGCDRNQGGYGLAPGLVLEDLNENVFEKHLQTLPDLEVIDFCGTYGDAIAAYNIKLLIELAKQYAKRIIVRTNGSLRNRVWWTQFAHILKGHNHEVWFCLDGLEDTHAIYRQGTDFDTIINNAKVFMDQGGVAVWQFIPWKHNEHQIKDAIKMSQTLGFKRFEFIKDVRRKFNAKNYITGEPISFEPWQQNLKFSKYEKINSTVLAADCRHLSQPSLYLNANGRLSSCCYFNTRRSFEKLEDLPDMASELASPKIECLFSCGR